MNYNVRYKKGWFWYTVKNVKGDGIIQDCSTPYRFFILDDESRIEVPMTGVVFKFSKERHYLIKESMNKEMGKV